LGRPVPLKASFDVMFPLGEETAKTSWAVTVGAVAAGVTVKLASVLVVTLEVVPTAAAVEGETVTSVEVILPAAAVWIASPTFVV
jgi:hypothetical protein